MTGGDPVSAAQASWRRLSGYGFVIAGRLLLVLCGSPQGGRAEGRFA
jgi:hypothetical protein